MIQPTITFDKIQLFNADNMEVMKQYHDKYFDIAIVDPPYGIGDEKLTQGGTWANKYKKGDASWDVKPTDEYWNELFRVSKDQIVFGANYFIDKLRPSRCFIIWDKISHLPTMADCEFAWVSIDSNAKICKVLRATQSDEVRLHICQKPVALYSWIIKNYVKPNMKILDTHLGSGSQTIAIDKANTIEDMNLEFVGIEIDSEYFNDSVERFKNYKQQITIFG